MAAAVPPFLAAGFRPLFACGLLAGLLLPGIWSAALLGLLSLPESLATAPVVWHAHEMLFGFGGAVLGGFLLTASKNWVGIRGYHGLPLLLLALAWLLARVLMTAGGDLALPTLAAGTSLYTAAMIAMVLATLWRHRRADSYRADNRYFFLALPALVPAQWLLLTPDTRVAGTTMAIAVFRLALLIMMERTLTQFMRAAFGIALRRHRVLDHAVKVLALLLIPAAWLPPVLHEAIAGMLAIALALRWLAWRPDLAIRRLDIGVMYAGQIAIIAELALSAFATGYGSVALASAALHAFTIGALGLVISAMVIRISRGHTGRTVSFDAIDKATLHLLLAAVALRAAGPLLWPALYPWWIASSTAAWTLAFTALAWRFIPLYLQPRADGKAG